MTRPCSACGSPLSPERDALDYITVCRPCADAGLIDRACVVVHGQHKGPDLVSLPRQVDGTTTYDRG